MIYYAEDDRGIRELVIYTLKNTGFEAEGFADGKELLDAVAKRIPELILLDIMMPGEDGIEILKKLRNSSSTKTVPIIMVTAKGSEYDKITGLDCGADDYISKPFGLMEMISRIKAVLRRTSSSSENDEYSLSGISINLKSHTVSVNSQSVLLTLKEFELLKMLIMSKGTVLTRDLILEKIWGYDFDGETRTVDVHIRTLRSKLGDAGDLIETVRGVGYRIIDKN
ncbi:MAG: response regulator transcription factor [Ruminococcaceae bacterium]|nr:response regulator transcription factor [Oscillospiraceae bacterium]